MVVYGEISYDTNGAVGVRANYQVTPRFGIVRYEVEGEFQVSRTDVADFGVFLFEGLDSRYILGLSIGQLAFFAADYQQAINAFTMAERALAPERASDLNAAILYYLRGSAYKEQSSLNAAISDYNRAIDLDANNVEAHNSRGILFGEQAIWTRQWPTLIAQSHSTRTTQ